MGILSTIGSALGGQIIDSVLGNFKDIFKAYFDKQISEAELRTKLLGALLDGFKTIEVAHADALVKTYSAFQETLRASPELVRMFKVVIYSQTFVLVWHQWFIPFYLAFFAPAGAKYPSSGTSSEWAYLLIGGLCGAAPMLLRAGPGAGSIGSTLKNLIGK